LKSKSLMYSEPINTPSVLVICESGFSKASELSELRSLGADGFLVGSALMKSGDIEGAVRGLVGAQ